MTEIPLLVPDASIAGRWYLRDEDFAASARALLVAFDQGRIRFIAPSHFRYEVPSLISKAVGGGRMTRDEGNRALEDFFALKLPIVQADDLVRAGYDLSVDLGCPFYDATYLALANFLQCRFVYADARLQRTLRGRFPGALWIENYVPPG